MDPIRRWVCIAAALGGAAACGAEGTTDVDAAAAPLSSSSSSTGGGSDGGPGAGGTGPGGAGGANDGSGGGAAGQVDEAASPDATSDAEDARSEEASPAIDSGSCPTLVANPCWRSYVDEYAGIAACFTHRSKCDPSGSSGDASQCGKWTDASKAVCLWADGTELDRMGGLNIVKNPAKTECYRREYGATDITFTFGNRKYTFFTSNSMQWVMTCPDGSQSRVSPTEVVACSPPGICCSAMSVPVCEPFPF